MVIVIYDEDCQHEIPFNSGVINVVLQETLEHSTNWGFVSHTASCGTSFVNSSGIVAPFVYASDGRCRAISFRNDVQPESEEISFRFVGVPHDIQLQRILPSNSTYFSLSALAPVTSVLQSSVQLVVELAGTRRCHTFPTYINYSFADGYLSLQSTESICNLPLFAVYSTQLVSSSIPVISRNSTHAVYSVDIGGNSSTLCGDFYDKCLPSGMSATFAIRNNDIVLHSAVAVQWMLITTLLPLVCVLCVLVWTCTVQKSCHKSSRS